MITANNENQFSISYISSGLFVTNDDWIHPKRQIDSYEVIYVVHGEVYIQEESTKYTLSKGDILILHPGRIHAGFQTSLGKTSFYWVHFIPSDYSALGIEAQCVSSADNSGFISLFKQLLHIANTSDYPGYASDAMMLLILNEIAVVQRSNKCKYSKLIKEVCEWVRINSDKKITVEVTADYFGYNPDYLSVLFKKTIGMGLKQYINKEKVRAAKNLILTSDYSIKQIADILGWQDENQFINYFKYHESVSPTKFRNLYYNTHFNKK